MNLWMFLENSRKKMFEGILRKGSEGIPGRISQRFYMHNAHDISKSANIYIRHAKKQFENPPAGYSKVFLLAHSLLFSIRFIVFTKACSAFPVHQLQTEVPTSNKRVSAHQCFACPCLCQAVWRAIARVRIVCPRLK